MGEPDTGKVDEAAADLEDALTRLRCDECCGDGFLYCALSGHWEKVPCKCCQDAEHRIRQHVARLETERDDAVEISNELADEIAQVWVPLEKKLVAERDARYTREEVNGMLDEMGQQINVAVNELWRSGRLVDTLSIPQHRDAILAQHEEKNDG